MQKIGTRATAIILTVIIFLSAVPCAYGTAADTLTVGISNSGTGRVHIDGTSIVDASGNEIVLNGTNLGGWMMYEDWMCPADVSDHETLLSTLSDRFGEDGAKELIDTYIANWITVDDLDKIASLGLNCVRIPFWWRNFQSDNGEWYTDASGNIDFSVLDNIINGCTERGLYVILDMHSAYGRQSIAQHTGKRDDARLYNDTDEGEKFRADTIELWRTVASRYAENETVIAFDLLNEPTCDMKNKDALLGEMWDFYNELYIAVREVAPDTIVMFEAVWRMDKLPTPAYYGWTNTIYSLHLYDYTERTINKTVRHINKYRRRYNVPVLIGEFNFGSNTGYALNKFAENEISFTSWSFKGKCADEKTTWFLYYGDVKNVEISKTSFEEIKAGWGSVLSTDKMKLNGEIVPSFESATKVGADGKIRDYSSGLYAKICNAYYCSKAKKQIK